RRVRVERVARLPRRVRLQQRTRIVRVASAEVGEARHGIVAARRPYRRAAAFLERDAVPALVAGLARLRDRADAPDFGTRLGIEPDDLRPAEARRDARARGADHDLAARDERPAVQPFAAAEVADLRVPDDLAGCHVERDDVHVRRAEI